MKPANEKARSAKPLPLMTRSLVLVFASMLVFLAVLGAMVWIGSGSILASWRESEERSLSAFIEERLTALAKDYRSGNAPDRRMPDAASVQEALRGLPVRPSWLIVAATDGKILLFQREPGAMMRMARGRGQADPGFPAPDGPAPAMGGPAFGGPAYGGPDLPRMPMQRQMRNATLAAIASASEWKEIRDGEGRVVLLYAERMPPFNERESNRVLLAAARYLLIWGLVVAAGVSAAFAALFARPLRRQSKSLAEGLDALASGRRDVGFPDCSVSEFSRISHSASSLQETLAGEEGLRRQWAADVAHDLRTPLAVLRGQIEGMADGVFAPDDARLERLVDETGRLGALIDGLALLTRVESPEFHPAFSEVNLFALLEGIAARFADRAREAGCRIEVVGGCPACRADPGLLERVMDNLVSNAILYGEKGGTVSLVARSAKVHAASKGAGGDGVVEISVENDGEVSPETLGRFFERHYRADPARGAGGSGLGLSIARAIMKAHGGDLHAESSPGSGKTKLVATLRE